MNFTFSAEQKMKVGSSVSEYRFRYQTTSMLLRLNAMVVNDRGKGFVSGIRYVL
ncbi:hypothetical protein [Sphingobacterium suaedae]|uniref:Uncharacterized protein n=1 Tax=Sphingobacterium suaedae TaxID=1686402 RepID=A0ABW5KMF6_9SPHI